MRESRVESLLVQIEDMILDYHTLRRQARGGAQWVELGRLRREKELLEAENLRLRQQQHEIRERLDRLLEQICIWEQEGYRP
ncbi:hypothetical protein [Acidithiobacillus acidisediminis]|uniref:hypothetical protein n=1 Tax=Acidithiobacillus TaxID=119977 RepID=UPI00200E72F5|nr:hypothetical protein [Acidithiobacillus sp. S30A2]